MKRYVLIAAAAIALTILSALVYGYEYGITPNHIQVIPFIGKIADSSLFPNDYFVDTVRRFPSVYPYLMAFTSKWIGLECLHLALFFVFKCLLLLSAYGLAKHLFGSDRTAFITMFLFALSPLINAYGLIGHDPLMKTSFYQTSMAAPLVLFAIWMFLKKRYGATAVTLALIYYINALMGNFLLLLFIFARGFKKWLVPFSLLMIPAVAWILRLNISQPLEACADFALYLKLWYTGHYFPSYFTQNQWYYFALILAFFVLFFHKGMGRCRAKAETKRFLIALVVMWAAAWIFGELIPVRSIILLQLLRSDTIFIVIGVIFAADYIRHFLEKASLEGMAIGGLTALALVEFSLPSYKVPVLIMLLLVSYGKRRFFVVPAYAAGLAAFSGIAFFAYHASPKMLCMFIFSAIMLYPTGSVGKGRTGNGKGIVNIATIAALIICALSFAHIYEYRIAARSFSNLLEEKDKDWKSLQLWAKDNTPKDAVFVAPLEMNGFRVFSNRSVFTDWVDGAAMHWKPGFEAEWVERLKRLGITGMLIKESAPWLCGMCNFADRKPIHRMIYSKMTEADFRRLAADYGVRYVIEDASKNLSFERAYSNGTFCVYKIR